MQSHGLLRLGRKLTVLLSALAMVALALPAAADAKRKGIGTPGIPEAIKGAGEIRREFQSTRFPERVVPLAREIKRTKPDLVGVQEAATWYKQDPSDGGWTGGGGIGQPASEAGELEQDFLELLMARLNRGKGPKYREIVVQEQFKGELPVDADDNTATGTGPLAALGADFDAQLVMHDAIIARKGTKVKLGKTSSGQYTSKYVAEIAPGIEVEVDRGWVSVEARTKGKGKKKGRKAKRSKFRFVNTHLEAFDPTIREAQAKELIAGPLTAKKQVVLAGDINSGRTDRHNVGSPALGHDPNDPLAFLALEAAGFEDNGAVDFSKPYPHTCCYRDMFDASLTFTHTVDHVLTKPGLKTRRAFVTGNDPSEMTPSGLWPSDHGGKVSRLQLKK